MQAAQSILEKEPASAVPAHALGIKGNGLLSDALIRTATEMGAAISRGDGPDDDFKLKFAGGEGQFDYAGDLDGLKRYLTQLRQPVHTGITDAVLEDVGKISGNVKLADRVQDEKILLHRILRHATTGSTDIPPLALKHLEKDFAACHADNEQRILTGDMWRMTGEIDLARRTAADHSHSETPPAPAILPGTGFDARNGFSFRLVKPLAESAANQNVSGRPQDALEAWLGAAIHDVTHNRYKGRSAEVIHLTPREMTALCRRAHTDIHNHGLENIVNAAGFDQRMQAVVAGIDARTADIENSGFLQNSNGAETQAKLRQLALATSALTPVVDSEALRQRWKHYFYSQRNDAPMEKIVQDFALLRAVCDHYGGMEHITPAHMEAIVMSPELHPVIAFAKETCAVLEESIRRAEAQVKQVLPPEALELKAQIAGVRDVFASASLTGLTTDAAHLPAHYQKVLEVLALSTGQGENAVKRMGKTLAGNFVNFVADIYTYPFRGRQEFRNTLASALAIYVWMNWDSQKPEPIRTPIVGGTEATLPGFDELGSAADIQGLTPAIEADPRGGIEGIDWHFHPGFFERKYRHYFNEATTGTSKTFMDLFVNTAQGAAKAAGLPVREEASAFAKGAYPTIEFLKPLNYMANLAQNYLGHLVYFSAMASKGMKSGPAGITRLLSFFSGFHDAARSTVIDRPLTLPLMGAGLFFDRVYPKIDGSDITTGLAWTMIGATVGYMYKRKPQPPVEFTQNITRNACDMMRAAVDGDVPCGLTVAGPEMAAKLGEAAVAFAKIEAQLPEHIRPANVRLKNAVRWGGIKNTGLGQAFTISAGHFRPVLTALQQMDMAMSLFSEQLGADGKVYQRFVKGRLDTVVKAMTDYQLQIIDEKQLSAALDENLRDVIAAQIHLTGGSPIYETLYGHAPDAMDMKRLCRAGIHAHAHQGRIESVEKAQGRIGEALVNSKMIKMRGAVMREGLAQTWAALAHEQVKASAASVKISAITAWDMIVDGARTLQHGFGNIPGSVKKGGVAALGGAALVATGLDIAGYTGPGADLAGDVSFASGQASAATMTTGVFLVVNMVDDQVMVHMLVGGACIMAGSAVYLVKNEVANPLKNYSLEQLRTLRGWLAEQFPDNKGKAATPSALITEQPEKSVGAKRNIDEQGFHL